jgi:hypothetical protein
MKMRRILAVGAIALAFICAATMAPAEDTTKVGPGNAGALTGAASLEACLADKRPVGECFKTAVGNLGIGAACQAAQLAIPVALPASGSTLTMMCQSALSYKACMLRWNDADKCSKQAQANLPPTLFCLTVGTLILVSGPVGVALTAACGAVAPSGWDALVAWLNEGDKEAANDLFQPIQDAILACDFVTALKQAQALELMNERVLATGHKTRFATMFPNWSRTMDWLEPLAKRQSLIDEAVNEANAQSDPDKRDGLLLRARSLAEDNNCLQNRVPDTDPAYDSKMAALGPPPQQQAATSMAGLGSPPDSPAAPPPAGPSSSGNSAMVTPPVAVPEPPAFPPMQPPTASYNSGSNVCNPTPPPPPNPANVCNPPTTASRPSNPCNPSGNAPTATVNSGQCNTSNGLTTCTDTAGNSCTTSGNFCVPTAQQPTPPTPNQAPLNLKPQTQMASTAPNPSGQTNQSTSVPACSSKPPYLPWGGQGSATIMVSGGQPCGVGWHDTPGGPGGVTVLDSMSVSSPPSHGTLRPQDQHVIIFTPASGYKGSDSFTLSMQEHNGGRRATLSVRVSVTIQ